MAARLGREKATGVEVGKAVLSRSSLPALRLLVYSADLPALKKCASERVSTCHLHSDSHSPIANSKKIKKTLLRSLICAAEASRPELVFFLLFNDCRHVRYDETLMKETMSMKNTMATVQHWVQFVCHQGVLVFTVSLCLLHDRIVRPCVGLSH